ncbi:glycoside hydrolase family 24 protein [Lepidopterella palustris CBS 459.81]|uniref:Glycoside hydrolase family 24 protein n=1 Tax=Lepidopterella palustris CBS 459.81 TaxID=1314670 RepID=A0A8E2DWL7_9PEZI|nr:glycoside hydrolase family 24 protein [Lepidopterella palustris CBS 459.81]
MTSKQVEKGMSPGAIEKLKKDEGFRSEPYPDGKNSKSIGYGIHESAHPDIFHKYGSPITKEQGHNQLTQVVERHERDLKNRLGSETWERLTQGQRDAIQRTAYNAGPKRTAETIGPDLKAGNPDKAADKLEKMAPQGMVGDRKVDLTARRRKEAEDFRQSGNQATGNCSMM